MAVGDTNSTSPWQRLTSDSLGGVTDILLSLLLFIAILVVTYLLARGIRWTVRRVRRTAPTAGSLLAGKVTMLVTMFVVTAFSLNTLFEVDLLSLIATLGIVSLALGFGLQNTVANLAAGVGLSIDRPFQVGDRIRVGNTWGDVTSIGLRSTRILTTSGELVAVPNAVLDRQEVWNNTHDRDVELRLELPFSISYDSSVELAEAISLRAARRHARILAYPEPRVQVVAMGDHGIHMVLKAWIDQARVRPIIMDRLFREMLRDFAKEGVVIPYPHQVNISTGDLVHLPAPTPEFLQESEDAPLVLVVTRGSESAQAMAPKILEFIKELKARVIVLHVRSPAMRFRHLEADKALNHYMTEAAQVGIKARPRSEVGELAPVVSRVAKEEGARLVILGQTMHRGKATGWYKNEVAVITKETKSPVLTLQTHMEQSKEFIQRWYERLRPESTEDREAERDLEENVLPPNEGEERDEDRDIEEAR